MSEQSSTKDGDVDPQHSLYILVLLILVFFVMGLVGFLICHILKKKGYRCRTFSDELDIDNKESLTQFQDDEDDDELNEDTVEKIVKCIIQNEANVEVLKEMLGESETDLPLPVPVPSALCPHRSSQDVGIPHHHTVHSTQAPCIHCSKKKRPPLHRQGRSKEGKSKMHPGETTVFSVGRFHVTHIGKKPASHESQEESLPEDKQESGVDDTDQELYSNEKLHWEGSQNGIVHTDGVQQRKLTPADSQTEQLPKENIADESPHLNITTNSNTAINEAVRKRYHKASSLQEANHLNSATSYVTESNCPAGSKDPSSEDLEEMARLDKMADQRAAYEASENEDQVLSIASTLDIPGKVHNRASSIKLQILTVPHSGLPRREMHKESTSGLPE